MPLRVVFLKKTPLMSRGFDAAPDLGLCPHFHRLAVVLGSCGQLTQSNNNTPKWMLKYRNHKLSGCGTCDGCKTRSNHGAHLVKRTIPYRIGWSNNITAKVTTKALTTVHTVANDDIRIIAKRRVDHQLIS